MRRRLISLMFVFAVLILLSQSVSAAGLCGVPDVAGAVADAEVIFSGRITKVEPVRSGNAAAGDYVVTFKVDTWWKGKPAPETRVFWRQQLLDCPYLPVGVVGEDYLVYGDPSRNNTTKDQIPEVTSLNRTSMLPASLTLGLDDWSKQTRISPRPTLNRADASDDIKFLRTLRQCGCFPIIQSPLRLFSWSPRAEGVSACQTCLRGRLKPF